MIKNIFKSVIFALIAISGLTACDPQDGDDYSLGVPDTLSADQVSFSTTVSPTNENIVTYTVTTQTNIPFSVVWDLGNGNTSKDRTVTEKYPLSGDYTVTLTVYTADGSAVSESKTMHFSKDDLSLQD